MKELTLQSADRVDVYKNAEVSIEDGYFVIKSKIIDIPEGDDITCLYTTGKTQSGDLAKAGNKPSYKFNKMSDGTNIGFYMCMIRAKDRKQEEAKPAVTPEVTLPAPPTKQ